MATLSEDDQDIAALAYRYLVTPDLAKVALGTNALSEWTEIPEDRMEAVLRALSAQDMKILRPVLDAQSEGRRYEIFHDGLAEPILSWRTRHGDPEIRQAQQEAADAARREARERKLRYLAVGAFVVALAVAGFAAFEYFQAKNEHTAAVRATAKATSVDVAYRVTPLAGQADFGARAAALVGLEAFHAWPTFEAQNQVLSFLQANPGLTMLTVPDAIGIRDIAFLGNATVATVGYDGTLRTRGISASAMQARLVRPPAPPGELSSSVNFTSLAVDPGGRLLAVGRSDGRIEVFATRDPRRPVRMLSVPGGAEVTALSFAPSGALAAGDDVGGVWMFSSATSWKPRKAFTAGQTVNGLGFCPGSAGPKCAGLLAVATKSRTWLWDPESPQRPPVDKHIAALGAAWAPDGSIAIAVDSPVNPGIRLIPRGGAVRFIATADLVESLSYAEGGKVLVAGGKDGTVTTWNVATGRSFGPPRAESGGSAVQSIAVSADGRTIAAGGDDGLSLWPLDAPNALAATIGSLGYANENAPVEIWGLAVGTGGQVAAATNRGVFLWRSSADDAARVPQAPTVVSGDDSLALAFHGDTLASAHSSSITLWDTADSCDRNGRLAADCRLGTADGGHDIYSLAFNRSGDLVAAGTFDGRVMLWDVSNPRKPKSKGVLLREPSAIYSLAFSPTEDLLAVAGKDGTIQVWNVTEVAKPTKVQVLRRPHGDQAVDSLAFSPDGTLLVSGGDDQQVILWRVDPSTGLTRLRSATQSGSNSILAIAFSRDGDGATLATGDDHGRACLYETASLQPLGSPDCLLGHSATHASRTGLWGVAFTPDGKALLTGGIDNPVVAWSSALWSDSRKEIDVAFCSFDLPALTKTQWSSAFYGTPLAHRSSTMRCR